MQRVRLFAGEHCLYALRRGDLIVGPYIGDSLADVAIDLFLGAMEHPLLEKEEPERDSPPGR